MKKILLSLLLLPLTTHAAQWEIASITEDRIIKFDRASMARVNGKYLKVWFAVEYLPPRTTPKGTVHFEDQLWYYDCSAQQTYIFQWVERDADRNIVSSQSNRFNPLDLQDVIPDTIGEEKLKRVCSVKL